MHEVRSNQLFQGGKVREHVMKMLGREPDPYSYVAYDIVWVYALSLMEVDAYDSEAVKAVLPVIIENYSGASGLIELDDAGDRKTGDYDVLQIFEVSPEEYEWVSVGVWLHLTDSVEESPFMKQLELEDWRRKAICSMDSASQKIDQIRDCESLDAKALLQEARTQLMESQNSFNQATLESYKNALNYSFQAISYANQASLKEVEYQQQRQQTFSVMETAKEKVNQVTKVENPDSKQLLQEAKKQLVEAENEYSQNNIEGCKNAYSSALQVISTAEQAYEKEQIYQQAKQQQQRLILIGGISVIAIIIIGTVLMMRKRR